MEKFKNINKELLNVLLELFYKEPGYYLDYDNLSKSLRISKNTLYKHIFYLEFCYLVRIIKNFRPNTLSTSRKLKRIYPYWWNLAFYYTETNDRTFENLILSLIDGKYYWRDLEKEIDIIKIEKEGILPIEIKNKDRINEKELNNLKYFMNKYKINNSLVLYKGEETLRKVNNKIINFLPFWKFLLKLKNEEEKFIKQPIKDFIIKSYNETRNSKSRRRSNYLSKR